jgi:hypothetical protein
MTAKQVMDLAERVERSSAVMRRWLSQFERHGGQFHALMAYDSAKLAGHYANTLINLAELGERSQAA